MADTEPGPSHTDGAQTAGTEPGSDTSALTADLSIVRIVLLAPVVALAYVVVGLLLTALVQPFLPSDWDLRIVFLLILLALLLVTLLYLRSHWLVIGESQVAVLEKYGQFSRLLGAGTHLRRPGERVRVRIPTHERFLPVGPVDVFMPPTHQLPLHVVVWYKTGTGTIPPDLDEQRKHRAYKLVYGVQDWEQGLRTQTEVVVNAVLASADLKEGLLGIKIPKTDKEADKAYKDPTLAGDTGSPTKLEKELTEIEITSLTKIKNKLHELKTESLARIEQDLSGQDAKLLSAIGEELEELETTSLTAIGKELKELETRSRTMLEKEITKQLEKDVTDWGIEITNVFLTVSHLPDATVQSIKGDFAVKKAQKEADADAVKAKAEAVRYTAIETARLDAWGQMMERVLTKIGQEVNSGQPMTPQALSTIAALRYIEALERMSQTSGGLFMPPQFPREWFNGVVPGGPANGAGASAHAGQQAGASTAGGQQPGAPASGMGSSGTSASTGSHGPI